MLCPVKQASALCMALALMAPIAQADDATATVVMPRVDVVGTAEDMDAIPGSAEVVDKQTLERSHVFTANEALRKVPGIHARDEEGFGLRPNLGIRGLNPTRSTKVTLLEDGIPLSYAPYGDNASYYHPPIDRFERVEVLKGAGQILFGPQTIGGVVNYVTPTPPKALSGSASLAAGNRDFVNAQASVGGKGMLADYTRKQGAGARDNMDHKIDDLNLKGVVELAERHALTLRASRFTEESTLTYSGLTEAEYANFGRNYNPFKNDKLETLRHGVSVTHEFDVSDETLLTTNVYYAFFDRDWWRQASTTSDNQCGFVNARNAGQAVDPDTCNSIQGRLREYTNWGVEPRLSFTREFDAFDYALDAGIRAHTEEQDRYQANGTSPTARTGVMAESSLRETKAYSAFALNHFTVGDFSVVPGVRYEAIDNQRTNRMTNTTGDDDIQAWIYSLGATWKASSATTLFAGVHRGFAPPRTEDIIDGSGTSTEVEPEESTNWELGVRSEPLKGANIQAALFRNDFERLIAVGSIAGGSTKLATGEALFQGLEIAGRYDHAAGPFLRTAYTWLQKAEQSTAFRQVVDDVVVPGSEAGNRQPYAPKHLLTAAVGYQEGLFDVQLEAVCISEQFSDFANSDVASPSGQTGEIGGSTVWNAVMNYRLAPKNATVFFTLKNLTDKEYIVDRTRGIQLGSPRLAQTGLMYNF